LTLPITILTFGLSLLGGERDRQRSREGFAIAGLVPSIGAAIVTGAQSLIAGFWTKEK
jgi:hypothetical protein